MRASYLHREIFSYCYQNDNQLSCTGQLNIQNIASKISVCDKKIFCKFSVHFQKQNLRRTLKCSSVQCPAGTFKGSR